VLTAAPVRAGGEYDEIWPIHINPHSPLPRAVCLFNGGFLELFIFHLFIYFIFNLNFLVLVESASFSLVAGLFLVWR
jgi:hypothetical protein